MTEPTAIDGASGGGQMLRNAVTLAAVTGKPVRVANIRGARPVPGLRPQHLTAVRAAAQACSGRLSGAEIGSQDIEFWPGRIESQPDWRLDVGTAGSLTLILQCLLPALSRACGESALTLMGGTDVPFSPPYDYFHHVFLSALAQLGPVVESRLITRGFYPKGGGEIHVGIFPAPTINALSWIECGAVTRLQGRSYSLGLPGHIAHRMREAALITLEEANYAGAEIELEIAASGPSEGCGIILWAECEGGRRFAGSALGRRGKRAEQVGQEAARALREELRGGGAVDTRLADQLIVWLALANGPSEFTTAHATDHLRSAAQVAQAVADARIEIQQGRPTRVRCVPA